MAQKRPFLLQNMLSWALIGLAIGSFSALLIGWLVDGCGARGVYRKTPIYFIGQSGFEGKKHSICISVVGFTIQV